VRRLKNIQFIHKVGLRLSLNITANVQLTSFFIHTGLKPLTPFINSNVYSAFQRASIKRCLRSAASWTGVWYTLSVTYLLTYLASRPIFDSQLD